MLSTFYFKVKTITIGIVVLTMFVTVIAERESTGHDFLNCYPAVFIEYSSFFLNQFEPFASHLIIYLPMASMQRCIGCFKL